jgi:phosphomannomutase
MLSVSGMRGWVGHTLSPSVVARFAGAFASHLRQTSGRPHPHVVFGRDSRPSGPMVERAATAGLLAAGCRVTLLDVVATPTVAIMINHLGADGGLVATASHNPIQWNGLKPLTAQGVAPPPEPARAIIERFHNDQIDNATVDQLQAVQHEPTANQVHVDRILARIGVEPIRAAGLKGVVDSVNGAGGPATAMLLEALGVEAVHLHGEPTGQFAHPPEPTEANLTHLGSAVLEHGADLGLAQDPDADRLALVDETGRYIGEEYTLALAALAVMAHRPGPAAANLSTSRMIDDIAGRFGQTVYRTPVGEANVSAAVARHACVVGGEGNGGVIWPEVVNVRDSLTGIALVLQLLATGGAAKLSDVVASIPAYAIVKDKTEVTPGLADRAVERLAGHFAGQCIDRQDGIRIDRQAGWVHVRPSNTEPIMRLIAEAADAAEARALIDEARGAIGSP